MHLNLTDKVIIVTGGASGIGESIVRTLAIEGAIPVIFDLKPIEDCTELIEELQIEHRGDFYFKVDLTEESQVSEAVERTFERYKRIDGIVNNAGINDGASLRHSPEPSRRQGGPTRGRPNRPENRGSNRPDRSACPV